MKNLAATVVMASVTSSAAGPSLVSADQWGYQTPRWASSHLSLPTSLASWKVSEQGVAESIVPFLFIYMCPLKEDLVLR